MDFKEIYKKLTAKKCAFIAIFFWATAFVLTKVVLKEVDATSAVSYTHLRIFPSAGETITFSL